jgi:signal transduction histidine kinase
MSSPISPSLIDILKERQDDIVTIWCVMLREQSNTHYSEITHETLYQWLHSNLNAIIHYLENGQQEGLDAFLSTLSQERFKMGFSLPDMMQGILIAKEAALPILWEAYPPGSRAKQDAIANLDGILRHMVGRFSEFYNTEFFSSMRKQQRRTSMMLESIQNAASTLELPQVMTGVAHALTRALGAANCYIYLAKEAHDTFHPYVCANLLTSETQNVFMRVSLTPSQDPLVYQVMQRQKPVICYNAPADPRIRPETPLLAQEHTLMVLPIGLGKHILGIAFATLTQTSAIDPGDIQLAFGIANAVALAIENSRLYEETRVRLNESQSMHQISLALLEKRDLHDVLEIVCDKAQELTGAEGCGVALTGEDPDAMEIVFQSGVTYSDLDTINSSPNQLRRALHSDQPVLINDIQPIGDHPTLNALLAVRLKIKGELLGVLCLVGKQGGFTTDDQRILILFADQAALAIDHARMLDRMQEAAVAEERHRLARDLHDSVTQSLYGVTLYAEAANRQMLAGNIPAATRNLQNVRATAHDSLRDMRLLIFELLPPTLSRDGLVAALQRRLKSVEERVGIETELLAEMNERLPAEMEEHLYAIAIETLNNALKYAQAKKVTIGLLKPGNTLVMRISDDGIGFNVQEAEESGGMGLDNIKERAERIHAHLEIQSEPGKGTSTTVTVEINS